MEVFFSTSGYFWNPGVAVLAGHYMEPVSIQIKLPTASRIHKISLKAKSDSERITSWSLQAKNEDGVTHTVYNPDAPCYVCGREIYRSHCEIFRYSVTFSIKISVLYITDWQS